VGALIADNGITSDTLATDCIGSTQLGSTAITEIQSGLATSTALATAQTDITTLKTAGIVRTNTAQAGAASTITLDASASVTNNLYRGCLILISAGTGAGQVRWILSYVGATKIATVDRAWATNPSSDSVFYILPFGPANVTHILDSPAVSDTGVLEVRVQSMADDSITGDTFNMLIDGKSFSTALHIIAAACAGKISGSPTGTEVILGLDGSTVRITATVDDDGNRTAITYS
jgi:hypothetical protein